MKSIISILAVVASLGAITITLSCVSTAAPVALNDPASPKAETAEAPEGAGVLASDPSQPSEGGGAPAASHDHAAHGKCTSAKEHCDGAHAAHSHATSGEHESAGHDGATSDTAVIYTCPMHPEIRENKPGRCPKCGMNLEPAKSTDK